MERRTNKERRKSVRDVMEEHSRQDHKNFKSIGESLKKIEEHMAKSNTFMENLSWLSDISKGTQLLKKPSLWFGAFIIGLVAVLGGIKTLFATFLAWILPK